MEEHHPGLGVFQAGFASWSRVLSNSRDEIVRLANFSHLCEEAVTYVGKGLEKPVAVDTLLELAESHGLVNDAGIENIEALIARAFEPPEQPKANGGAAHHPEQQQQPEPKRATAYLAPDEASIPPRAWLHAGHYVRKAATATVAPGGFCKTTLSIYEAISMVADGLTVWYISGEDPRDELDRRIAAHCAHHRIELAKLPGKLFIDDQETYQLCIAKSTRAGTSVLNDAAVQQFELAILADRIDAVILDPFISFHQVAENDNSSVDAVVKRLALVAKRTNCCIEISHHVRKPFAGQGSLTVDDARGGGAIINAVRSGRVINRMNAGEAEKANISSDDRHLYLRLDIGKRNMAPPDKATWFRLVPVPLKNGDSVQALIPWQFKVAGASEADTEWVRLLVRQKAYRCDAKSPDWLGYEVARRFGLNVADKADCVRISRMIGQWLTEGAFKKLEMRDVHARKKFMFYVGTDARGENEPSTVVQLFNREEEDD
jgi:hypothetical protein